MTRLTHKWPEEVVDYFTGIEVENTKAKGLRTLFVVGIQDPKEVVSKARQQNAVHVYLGANHSYCKDWVRMRNGFYDMVKVCVDKGLIVSLNFWAHELTQVKNDIKELWTHENFIPQLSISIPNINTENTYLNIKIDDNSIQQQTNKGVWCFDLYDVIKDEYVTTWNQFANDKPI